MNGFIECAIKEINNDNINFILITRKNTLSLIYPFEQTEIIVYSNNNSTHIITYHLYKIQLDKKDYSKDNYATLKADITKAFGVTDFNDVVVLDLHDIEDGVCFNMNYLFEEAFCFVAKFPHENKLTYCQHFIRSSKTVLDNIGVSLYKKDVCKRKIKQRTNDLIVFDKEDEYEEVIEESESVNKIKEQNGFCVVLSKRGYQMSYDVVERIVRNVFYNLEGDAEEKE
jgi:hypothetical protein